MKKKPRRKTNLVARLDSASSPVYLLDASRRIIFFNSGCEALTGWKADDVVGCVCDFATETDVTRIESVTGSLCPPPEVFSGFELSLPARFLERLDRIEDVSLYALSADGSARRLDLASLKREIDEAVAARGGGGPPPSPAVEAGEGPAELRVYEIELPEGPVRNLRLVPTDQPARVVISRMELDLGDRVLPIPISDESLDLRGLRYLQETAEGHTLLMDSAWRPGWLQLREPLRLDGPPHRVLACESSWRCRRVAAWK